MYIEGDLVGGLDVMKELHENGELIEMFEGADKLKTKLKYLTKKSKVRFSYNINRWTIGSGSSWTEHVIIERLAQFRSIKGNILSQKLTLKSLQIQKSIQFAEIGTVQSKRIFLRVVQTQAPLFLKLMSERVGSNIERL